MRLQKEVKEFFETEVDIVITSFGLRMGLSDSWLLWQETKKFKPEAAGKLPKLPNQSLRSKLAPNLQHSMVYTS